MTPEDWFTQLTERLPGELPAVTDGEREALLDLARVAAHTSERWTAPVSTFLAGLALADVPPADRAATLADLVATLEA